MYVMGKFCNLKAFAVLSITVLFVVIWILSTGTISLGKQPAVNGSHFFKTYVWNQESKVMESKSNKKRELISTNRSPVQSLVWTNKIQLCIMFNLFKMSPNKQAINLLVSYYSLFFNHIMLLFEGDWSEKPNYIPQNITFSGCKSNNGLFQQHCLLICLNETWDNGDKPEGYLYIADDMFVNLTKMSLLPVSHVWYINPDQMNYTARASVRNTWKWGQAMKPLETVVNNLPEKWKHVLVESVGFPDCIHASGLADIVYVPHLLARNMTDFMNYVIRKAKLISEVAFPLAVDIVAPNKTTHFIDGILWNGQRNLAMIEKSARTTHFVHPVKLSSKAQADLWKSLMEEVKAAML